MRKLTSTEQEFISFFMEREPGVKDMESAAKLGERICNNLSFPSREIAQAIHACWPAKESFLEVSLLWAESLAKLEKWQYDLRNEASVIKARELCHYLGSMRHESNKEACRKFVNEASMWHRTLQQSFSSLVFCFLDLEEDEHLGECTRRMREEHGEYWHRMPLV